MSRRAVFVSIVDDAEDDDIDKITSFCNYCESLGFYHKLGPRIYPEGPKPYDSDKWLQCYNCGEITPKVLAKQLNEIAPIVDPPENIHDSNKVVMLATQKRTRAKNSIFEKIKKSRPGASRAKDYVDVDLDLRAQLQTKGKKLVSYSSNNDQFEG
jgi:hypothetical protein